MKIKNLIISLITIFALSSCTKSTAKTSNNDKPSSTVTKIVTPAPIQTTPAIKKVEAAAFKDAVVGKTVQLVDVRTPQEYKQGHLKNAVNINIFDGDFMTQMAAYKKDEPVYVYCRSGGRSMKAARKLKASGYNVVNLNGGFMGWSSKGFPLEK